MSEQPQRTLKGYELYERIGAGGFGEVYCAFQPAVGREVAIKVILPQYTNQPDFIRRFEMEAQTIARLEHPHIVPLYDYWCDAEGAYLVMRWLRTSLAGALRQGPWSVEASALLLEQIAAALNVAHRAGVIHRDIKPDNILLDEDDNAYLADFGIAKDLRQASTTQEGAMVGSPAYMTPEQIRGEPLTAQTDIYSLGLVLYQTLVNQKPYPDTSTPYELIQHQLNTPLPDLHKQRSDLPAALNEVMQTATAKNPAARYATAQRFAAAFRAAIPTPVARAVSQPLAEPLTTRELEILGLIVAGLSNAEIAQKLVLALETVKWYVKQIYAKLDVHSRYQAAERARRLNLLSVPSAGAVESEPTFRSQRASLTGEITETGEIADIANPYKGLRAFQEADAADFFGREALTQQLLVRLGQEGEVARFLAVVGPSGSGKSSAVRAGLIPALRDGALSGSNRWFIVEMLPGAHPLEELEAALLRIAVNPPTSLLEQLREDERGLLRAVKRVLPDDNSELLLVIDQFEEAFTLLEDQSARVHFLDSLLAAVIEPRSRLRVIVTLRADFYDRPLQYTDFGDLVRKRTEVVLPLSTAELEQAIVGPAERAGLVLEPGLTATIVTDVGEQPGTLPLLEYALTELFERREGRTLTLAAYGASGGVLGALARRADELYNGLDAAGQAATRQLFLRLLTLGEGSEDTRRRVRRTELSTTTGDGPALDGVIDAFSQYRLLTFDRDPVTRGPTVEVAHEALLRTWQRLRTWLDDSREEVRLHRRLTQETSEWASAGRDPGLLATGTRLDQFEAWAKETTLALNQEEQEYLPASIAEREARHTLDEARKGHELNLQRRATNRLRYLIGVLLAFLAVAGALSAFALSSRQEAFNNEATAIAERKRADDQKQIAFSRQLAAQSIIHLNSNLPLSLLLSIEANNVAATALPQSRSEAKDSLLKSLQFSPHLIALFPDNTNAILEDVAFSSDGKMLTVSGSSGGGAVKFNHTLQKWDLISKKLLIKYTEPGGGSWLSRDGKILISGSTTEENFGPQQDDNHVFDFQLWDSASGQRFGSPINDRLFPVYDLALSPDSKTLALSGCSQWRTDPSWSCTLYEIQLWDIPSAKLVQIPTGTENFEKGLAFSPDSKLLASTNEYRSTTIRFWDTKTGQPLYKPFIIPRSLSVQTRTFSPDGKLLAMGFTDGTTQFLDLANGQSLQPVITQASIANDIAFSPDGKTLASANEDGTIQLWDVESGKPLTQPFTGHTRPVRRVKFSPDGTTLASIGDDRVVGLWDLTNAPPLSRSFINIKPADPVHDFAFSPDGKILASTGTTVRLWDTATGRLLGELSSRYDIGPILFSPDGTSVASTGYIVQWWDVASKTPLGSFPQIMDLKSPDFLSTKRSTVFGPNGKTLINSGCAKEETDNSNSRWCIETEVQIWDVASGQMITDRTYKGSFMGWTSDGKTMLLDINPPSSQFQLWDTINGQAIRQPFESHSSITFSADNKTLAIVDSSKLQLQDILSGKVQGEIALDSEPAKVIFSPNGKTLAVIWNDRLRLWDVTTGQPLGQTLSGKDIKSVLFSPDSQILVSTYHLDNDYMQFWDVATGQILGEPTNITEWQSLVFSPGGVLTVLEADGIKLWPISVEAWEDAACRIASRNLTVDEWKQYLGDEPYRQTCPNLPVPTAQGTPTLSS